MASLRTLTRRLRGTFRSSSFERRMDEEVQFHLEREIEQRMRTGAAADEARAAALRAFGGVARVKDECRDSWGLNMLETLLQDVRFGARQLLKTPAFTLMAVLILALGIGANSAIFSAVHTVLLRQLPYGNGDRLIVLHQPASKTGLDDIGFSVKEIADYRAQATSLDAVVEYHSMGFNILGGPRPERVRTGVVSANYFSTLGVNTLLGRTFTADDDRVGAPAVLVLSYAYWQNSLGGDPSVVGRAFHMNDKVHTVVGVLPPIPGYPDDNDVYMPASACPFRNDPTVLESRSARILRAIGRMKDGVTLDRARTELATVESRLAASYPDAYERSAGITATADSLHEELTRRARPTLLMLLATTIFVLIIVCANVANLTLARVSSRNRELSVRAALGAGRSRIARQLLTESLLLALIGGAAGAALAWMAQGILGSFIARFTPVTGAVALDPTVLAFTAAVSIATGVAFGLAPALPRRRDLADTLSQGGARSVGGLGAGIRNTLIASQVALSFMLLVGAGLMIHSFVRLLQIDPGFRADRVLTMRVFLNWSKYNGNAKTLAFYRPLIAGLQQMPGVEAAAVGLTFPLDQARPMNLGFVIEGRPLPAGVPRPQADFGVASPQYFAAMGIPVLQGRAFTDDDREGATSVAVVSQSMVRHFFGGENPVGRMVSTDGGHTWLTIVGVVGDVRQYGLDRDVNDSMYLPFAQHPMGGAILVRTANDPRLMIRGVQEVISRVDADQPVGHVQTLEEVRSNSLTSPKVTMLLVGLFAGLALVITAIGIAGVVSFSVTQRVREIGVRMALGAQPSSVMRLVLRQGMTPVVAGLVVGLGGALALVRVMERMVFGIHGADTVTFVVAPVLLAAVAAAACFAPSRRAASTDPMAALRAD